MKLIAFISLISIFSIMLCVAVCCLMACGSNADDTMLGKLQYMTKEEIRRAFSGDSNQS